MAAAKRSMWDYAPAGLLGAATLVGAYGTLEEGAFAKRAGNLNARLARQSGALARGQAGMAADAELSAGRMEESAVRRQGKRIMGSNRAAVGASGFDFSGSTVDALADTAAQIELEALTKRFESQTRAQQITYAGELQAWQSDAEAKLQEWRGGQVQRGSFLKAFGALLGGVGGVAKAWPSGGTTRNVWDDIEY